MCDTFVLRLPFNRYKRDLVNTWRRNEQPFHDSTFCQMMNCWRFCLKPKILLLFNLICASALKISPGYVGKITLTMSKMAFVKTKETSRFLATVSLKENIASERTANVLPFKWEHYKISFILISKLV